MKERRAGRVHRCASIFESSGRKARSEGVPLGMKSHELMRPKRVQSVCVPCVIAKLDFECVFRKHFHHGSHFASGKPKLWQIGN